MTPEEQARVNIDRQLEQAGWSVQDTDSLNLYAGTGVAAREFPMKLGHGHADYLLYVNRKAVGVVEAKPEGFHFDGRGSAVRKVRRRPARLSTVLPATAAFPVRKHRRGDPVHERARPRTPQSPGVRLSQAGNPGRVDRRTGQPRTR